MNRNIKLIKGKHLIKDKLVERIKNEEYNSFPSVILIDTISYCNLKCSMCPHENMKRKPSIMEWDLYKKIIDEIANKRPDARIWITFFGEGLILKDLDEKIKYAKDKGLTDVVLNSNGDLLNYEKAVKLVKSGLDAIYVGIDAFYPETHKKLRVGADLRKVVKGVLDYKKALEQYGNSKQAIYVQYVVMDENQDELDAFINFWKNKGISTKVRPKVSWAGKKEANNLKDCEERLPCNWGMNTINIADDGRVCLCSVDLNCEVAMGDIKKNSIEEVWNSSLKEFRLNQLKGNWKQIPEFCQGCKDWQSSYAEYI